MEEFFVLIFIACLGCIFGKCFKRFNPFLILLGCVLFLPVVANLVNQDQPILMYAFAAGFLINFKHWVRLPRWRIENFFCFLKRRTVVTKTNNTEQHSGWYDQAERARLQEEDLKRRDSEMRRIREEDFKRREEELLRKQREFERWRNEQNKREKKADQPQHPQNFQEACSILGVPSTADFSELKKPIEILSANIIRINANIWGNVLERRPRWKPNDSILHGILSKSIFLAEFVDF